MDACKAANQKAASKTLLATAPETSFAVVAAAFITIVAKCDNDCSFRVHEDPAGGGGGGGEGGGGGARGEGAMFKL